MKYDSVIFDLDGTLLDTLDDLRDSVNFALRAHGMPERSTEEIRRFVGNGVRNLVKRAAPEESSEETVDSVLSDFRARYKDHSKDKTKPYNGICELLASLRERGLGIAVVSNKIDSAVQILIPEYFPGLVDVAVGELAGVERKPAPHMVRIACEKLGCSRPVYVGDSEVDVQTAKNAGIDGVFVTWGFRNEADLREVGAEILVNTADELYERLV